MIQYHPIATQINSRLDFVEALYNTLKIATRKTEESYDRN
jgi:hypothetical protein